MNNEVTVEAPGFYISYNPDPPIGSDGPETAIVIKGGKYGGAWDRYLILRGDHRKMYQVIAPKGLNACVAYWRSHASLHSRWSDPEPDAA